jgi:hypothetical protein
MLNVSCSDDSGNIANGFPKFSFVNSIYGLLGNYSFTNVGGNNYSYNMSLNILGNYSNFTFYCRDGSGNTVAMYVNIFIQVLLSAPANPGSSSVGGMGGRNVTEIIIQEVNLTSFCGDGTCGDGENPLMCPQDCKVNIETAVSCLWVDPKSCIYSDSWFVTLLVLFVIASAIYIVYKRESKGDPGWMRKWF